MKSKAIGGLAVLGVVGLKVLLKLGIGFGVGTGIAQAEIEASKYESWPSEFKQEFVASCVRGAKSAPWAQSYCQCYTDILEGEHLIPTKYNSVTTSEAQYEEHVGKIVDDFLESPVGKAGLEKCLGNAQKS